MAGKKITTAPEMVELAGGLVSIPRDTLTKLVAESFARNGVVLANERIKVNIVHGDVPVEYTLSLYAARSPITEAEAEAVAKVKEERDTAKATKAEQEAALQRREKTAAFELGQQSTMTALRNIGELAAGVQALTKLAAGK